MTRQDVPHDSSQRLPRRRSDLLSKILDSRHRLLYDRLQDTVHVLNLSADLIWNACDGEHTVEEIEREIRTRFNLHASDDVQEQVLSTLGLLGEKGLLVPFEPDATPDTLTEKRSHDHGTRNQGHPRRDV